MSTTLVETWAVDLADVGPIYPMVGTEVILWIIGMAFWIIWHIWQVRQESRTYAEDIEKLKKEGNVERALRGEAVL